MRRPGVGGDCELLAPPGRESRNSPLTHTKGTARSTNQKRLPLFVHPDYGSAMKSPLAASALCMILAASQASAQLALPGAVPPGSASTTEKAPRPKRPPKPAAAYALPGVETLVGRPLLLNGANGQLQF